MAPRLLGPALALALLVCSPMILASARVLEAVVEFTE